ncbi:MAG: hypothetical protein SVW02_03735 [Candidatus Nanohaloarchaea archaeon]|nr:hypothetical protein [Candidatus Nanohaloarchaea archaeon]
MADDERNQSSEDERGEASGQWEEMERREHEAAAAATYGELSDEDRDQMQQAVQERITEEREGEHARGRAFSKDQIIHEAAIMVRGMYGTPKYSLEIENYGERDESKGYYSLIDCWAIAGHRLDLKYHSEFLKRATVVKWGSRINRYLIPNYYVYAMKGVDRAIKKEYVSPLIGHKIKYKVAVHVSLPFLVVGPPLAYFDWLPWGITEAEAKEYAKLEEEESTPAEDYRSVAKQLEIRLETLTDQYQEAAKEANEAEKEYEKLVDKGKVGEANDAKARYEQLKEQAEQLLNEIEEVRDEYERVGAKVEEEKGG